MAELFFWIFIVPLGFCVAGGVAISKLAKLDEPLDLLPAWRRLFRRFVLPGWDDTPKEAEERRRRAEVDYLVAEIRRAGRNRW